MIERESYLPISNEMGDKLHFKTKAMEISQFIENTPNNIPYAFCINGSWSSGKSSMLNLVEEFLNKGKCKVIRFNPWIIVEYTGSSSADSDKFFDIIEALLVTFPDHLRINTRKKILKFRGMGLNPEVRGLTPAKIKFYSIKVVKDICLYEVLVGVNGKKFL